jgi:hypothetical protein
MCLQRVDLDFFAQIWLAHSYADDLLAHQALQKTPSDGLDFRKLGHCDDAPSACVSVRGDIAYITLQLAFDEFSEVTARELVLDGGAMVP